MNAAQWLVLDNLAHRWPYRTNLNRKLADDAYRWAVDQGYVEHGVLTAEGAGALLAEPTPKEGTP